MVDCLIKGERRLDCLYVDSMLGWLARILRIVFGSVVYYKSDADDSELLKTSCLVVTRDWELYRRRRLPTILFVTDDHVKWIAAFIKLGLVPFIKSRCPHCGGDLEELKCEDVEKSVGHPVRSTKCWRCLNCGHLYWMGSHWRSLVRLVEEASRVDIKCLDSGLA